jgi:hypothetical protein
MIDKYFKNYSFHVKMKKGGPNVKKLQLKDYEILKKYNYTIKELKHLLKILNIPCLNKNILKKTILNYTINMMYLTYSINKIKRCWKNYFIRLFNKSVGPSFRNKNLSNNDEDFYTVEKLNDIDYYYYFSYKDVDGFVYTFNIISIITLIDKNCLDNPYNRKKFDNNFINSIKNRYNYNKILNKLSKFDEYKSTSTSFETKIHNIFIKIDELGNYSDVNWFLELNRLQLKKFLFELYEIWTFRAQLSNTRKVEICPPNGNPFHNIPRSAMSSNSILHTYQEIRNIALQLMEKILFTNANNSDKNLCALYILSALTLVSENARNSLPWLYASVNYIN